MENKTAYILTFSAHVLVVYLTFLFLKRLSNKELENMEKSPEEYISSKLGKQKYGNQTDNHTRHILKLKRKCLTEKE